MSNPPPITVYVYSKINNPTYFLKVYFRLEYLIHGLGLQTFNLYLLNHNLKWYSSMRIYDVILNI